MQLEMIRQHLKAVVNIGGIGSYHGSMSCEFESGVRNIRP
jgi:hypothetical protein